MPTLTTSATAKKLTFNWKKFFILKCCRTWIDFYQRLQCKDQVRDYFYRRILTLQHLKLKKKAKTQQNTFHCCVLIRWQLDEIDYLHLKNNKFLIDINLIGFYRSFARLQFVMVFDRILFFYSILWQ